MKKNTLLIILSNVAAFLLSTTISYSQCVDLARGGGGIYTDGFPAGAVSDASGNMYLCGGYADTAYFGSTILTSDPNAGYGYFCNKYDSTGNLLWSKSLGSLAAPFGLKPITISGGYIYITCNTTYFQQGVDTIINDQVVLWKLDVAGNLVWRKNYYSSLFSYPCGIIPDGSGGVYLTGRFRDTLMVGTVTLLAPNYKTWIARIGSSGNTVWAKQAAATFSAFTNRGNDMVVLSSGDIVLTGYYRDSLQFGNHIISESLTNAAGNTKYKPYIALFDASGNNQWIKGFTTEGQNIHSFFDCGYGLTKDNADNIYVTGSLSDSTRIGGLLVNADSGQTFLAKFSSAGTPQWIKLFGGNNGFNWGIDAATDNQNIFIVGNFYGTGIFGSSIDTSSTTQVFVAKADMNGNIVAHVRATGNGASSTYQSHYDNTGSIYIGGDFSGLSESFPFASTLTNTGPDSTYDAFLWKVCLNNIVSVNEIDGIDYSVFLFPNPATSEIRIENAKGNTSGVEIFNTLGEKVWSRAEAAGSTAETINVSALSPGIYFVRVQTSDGMSAGKFMKQ